MYSHYEQSPKKVVEGQRQIRSALRKNLHLSIFKEDPQSAWSELNLIPAYHHSDLHYRLEKIIVDITENQKIVNGKRIYHYTSLPNLTSISKHKYFMGHDNLETNKIRFDRNTFTQVDRENGDARVICFCPGQVDIKAYTDFVYSNVKNNSCRLTLDINNLSSKKSLYNQFFKLADLGVWFSYRINFEDMHIEVSKHDGVECMELKVKFKEFEEQTVQLDKKDVIFYGDIFCINRFCAVQFINMISKMKNDKLKEVLFDYLNQLNDTELTKILIIFSQALTLFAEYNFNCVLPLNEIKIREVLILGESKFKYDFADLDESGYANVLNLLSIADYNQLQQYVKSVDDNSTISNYSGGIKRELNLNLFGEKRDKFEIPSFEINANELSGNLFVTNDYIETRVGVSGNIFLDKIEAQVNTMKI